jgi:hypothetical protein
MGSTSHTKDGQIEHIVFYGLDLLDLALYEDSWVGIMN